jgi:hypothetical protein
MAPPDDSADRIPLVLDVANMTDEEIEELAEALVDLQDTVAGKPGKGPFSSEP